MGKDDNTAGWILTTLVYSLGGRMETGIGTKAIATVDNPADGRGAEHAEEDALDRQLDGLQLRLRLERHQPGLRGRPGRHVRQRFGRLHEPRPGEQHRPEHLRAGADPARHEQERRRPRRRHARRRTAGCERRRSRGGGEVDRLLLRAAAGQQGAGDPQREDPRPTRSSRSAFRAAGLQQGAVRPREHLDQAVHQRAAESDEAVHDRDLLPEADPGAGGLDPERLPLARCRRRGGAHRSEREHPEPAPAGERSAQSAIRQGT